MNAWESQSPGHSAEPGDPDVRALYPGSPPVERRPAAGDYLAWVLILGTIVAFGTGTYRTWQDAGADAVIEAARSRPLGLPPPFGGREVVRFLLLGTDDRADNGRSDTIILAALYPKASRVSALSVPRDSLVEIPGHGADKINAAYHYGGASLTMRTVNRLFPTQPADYYVRCDFEGFQKMVDALGGVVIEVEKNMSYTDRSQRLYIRLKKGRQRLRGYDAMCYVRYRSDARGDIGRTERQQKFLRAALRESLKLSSLPKSLALMKAFRQHVTTNMGAREVADLARVLPKVKESGLATGTLPGTPRVRGGRSYWVLDRRECSQLVRSLNRPAQTKAPEAPQAHAIEVLNGCGRDGAAKAIADQMERRGFTVLRTGNAESFGYPESQIRCYHRDGELGEQIQRVLQCGSVVYVNAPSKDVEATIIVGRDLTRT